MSAAGSLHILIVLEKLRSLDLMKLDGKRSIHSTLTKCCKIMDKIVSVLKDAEEKHLIGVPDVKKWVGDLEQVAHELDDILDELMIDDDDDDVPEVNNSPKSTLRNWSRVSLILDWISRNKSYMMLKLDGIMSRLHRLAEEATDLGLKSMKTDDLQVVVQVDDSCLYGRTEDKAALIDRLLKGSDEQIGVISIYGVGGIGKTALARCVYNDPQVQNHFDIKAWVCCVYDDMFDVFKARKMMYESLTSEIRDLDDFDDGLIQSTLVEKLSRKRFLLVLDDVWCDSYESWDMFRGPLLDGSPGSRIIVTTRSDQVAKVLGSDLSYHVNPLANGDSFNLLSLYTGSKFAEDPSLELIMQSTIEKCAGLPLAMKVIGSALRAKTSLIEWQDLLNSQIWDLGEANSSSILPALILSYNHLPPHLKLPFVYCSIFPNGYEFDKNELVLLWMAEGYISHSEMEEVGLKYFNELLSRCFFEQSSAGESRFKMHDLMNDLAQFVAGEKCFRLDADVESDGQYKVSQTTRHFSFIRHKYDVFRRFKGVSRTHRLLTFLPLPVYKRFKRNPYYLSYAVLQELLPELRHLRVMSLSGYVISELPNSIGDLKHLRYLDLSRTSIKQLPESVCALYFLQTLLLHSCKRLTKLPSCTEKLINLRHMDITDTEQLQEMPRGMGKLTSLQTLSKVVLGKSHGLRVSELGGLSNLQGAISIKGLHHVIDKQNAVEAKLGQKQGLSELAMEWSSNLNDDCDEVLENEILEVLQPHTSLRKLKIASFRGTLFPNWMGNNSFSSMMSLTLNGCKNCSLLPSLGQLPLLKDLHVRGMDGVRSVGAEFYGISGPEYIAFPSLETLTFEGMINWEEWCDSGNEGDLFPRLREISIYRCPKLVKVSLPRLISLHFLNIRGCSQVVLASVVGLASVTNLSIREISSLTQLHEGFMNVLGALEDLDISACGELVSLFEDEAAHQYLVNLRDLDVYDCPQLVSLSLPHNLERLVLRGCDKLEKLPNSLSKLNSLKELSMWQCNKLFSFAGADLPRMLKKLEIRRCKGTCNMFLEHDDEDKKNNCPPDLERLLIQGCRSLKSLPVGLELCTTLKELLLFECRNLEPYSMNSLLTNSMSSLELIHFNSCANLKSLPGHLVFEHLNVLIVRSCPRLESIPETCLPPRLRRFEICYCDNLKSLPPMQSLASLEDLQVYVCQSLESFPQGMWPPKLRSLHLGELNQHISKWDLSKLPPSLDELTLTGKFQKLYSFSDAECSLPSSLVSLHICKPLDLKDLSFGLENLSALKELSIYYCPRLQSLPNSLLPTLSSLKVKGCPLLQAQFLPDKTDIWHELAQIPLVEFEGRVLTPSS